MAIYLLPLGLIDISQVETQGQPNTEIMFNHECISKLWVWHKLTVTSETAQEKETHTGCERQGPNPVHGTTMYGSVIKDHFQAATDLKP